MKKNTLFSVDINKENPIKTILKNGKVPIIRISKTGFRNYSQEKYFNNRKDEINDIFKGKGCFVQVGGIQGIWVSGGHMYEKINIGYLEPDDEIYITYSYDKNENFIYSTAKKRFNSSFDYYLKNFEKNNNNIFSSGEEEDFDFLSEAIVDTSKIHKVIEIYPEDFYKLLKYTNDGYFKIFHVENLYWMYNDYMPSELKTSLINTEEYFSEDSYTLFNSVAENNISILNYIFFYDYFKNRILDKNIVINFEKKQRYVYEKISNLYKSLKQTPNFFFNSNNITLRFDDICFFINNKGLSINKDSKEISISDCFIKYKKELYLMAISYKIITKELYPYINIKSKDAENILNIFNTKKLLKKYKYNISSDLNTLYFFKKDYIIEYNYCLNDSIIEYKNNFYNKEKIKDINILKDVEYIEKVFNNLKNKLK